jgi:hypothetical protein
MTSRLQDLLERHVASGTVGVLLAQVEMGERMQILIDEFQALPKAADPL